MLAMLVWNQKKVGGLWEKGAGGGGGGGGGGMGKKKKNQKW
jgi:hypothetical protein